MIRTLCLALLVVAACLELVSARPQQNITTKKPNLVAQPTVYRLEIVDTGRCHRRLPLIEPRNVNLNRASKTVYACRPYYHLPMVKLHRQIHVDVDRDGKRVFDFVFSKEVVPKPKPGPFTLKPVKPVTRKPVKPKPVTLRPENIADINKKVDFNLQSVAEAILIQNSEVNN